MNIDERLEKLTERHEALTRTVELMAAENRAGLARLHQVENIHAQMVRSIDTLARVVELHEHRLDRLEGAHPKLEFYRANWKRLRRKCLT